MGSINGHSGRLSRACPSCSKYPSFFLLADSAGTCGPSTPLSPTFSSPSPSSGSYFTSQSSSLARHQMPAHFRHQHWPPCVMHGKGLGMWKRIWLKIITPASHFKQALSPTRRASNRRARRRNSFPSPIPLESIYVQPRSMQVDIRVLQTMHTNDARCVSWILWNITDPEAVEAAIRLAGTIRWFENGVDVKPPYESIVSAFYECFDSTGKVHPGSRDMAYYSIRAILWIHVHAACKSEDVSPQFPRPAIRYTSPSTDPDLTHLLEVCHRQDEDIFLADLYCIRSASTPAHIQWASNAMLHLSWAKRGEANALESIGE